MWKIIRVIGKNIQAINDMGLNKELNFFYYCYLSKSHKHYSHSKDYSDIVSKLLDHLPIVADNLTTLNTLFPVALNLGLLEGKHCQKELL